MAEHTLTLGTVGTTNTGISAEERNDRGITAIIGGKRVIVGEAWAVGPNEDGEKTYLPALANATLWAAAPDLLAACRKAEKFIATIMEFYGQGLDVLNWHENGDAEPWDSFFDDNSDGTELDALQAAISKATERPS